MQGVTCFTPPPLIPYPNENKFFLVRVRIRINWLTKQFRVSLAAKASDVLVQRYAHYHILIWLGSILFMDKSTQQISIMSLQLFDPINNAKKYSWGSAALGWLYRHLCKASNKKVKQIGKALMLVQLWTYSKFPHICQITRTPQ